MKSVLRPLAVLSAGLPCLFVSPCAVQAQSSSSSRVTRTAPAGKSVSRAADGVVIPGPLRSFLRMAGISQKIPTEDVLPLLARNVYMQGYSRQKPTEFLILLDRYVQQARELQVLAGSDSTIHVENCQDAGTLIQILGYQASWKLRAKER